MTKKQSRTDTMNERSSRSPIGKAQSQPKSHAKHLMSPLLSQKIRPKQDSNEIESCYRVSY